MPDAAALCEEHIALAYHCARRFVGRGVPLEELRQQAGAALTLAATRFDESRGLRFSTYAVPCILGELKRLCERLPLVHLPRGDREALARAYRERALFHVEHHREPTADELAARVDLPPEELGALLCATLVELPIDDEPPPVGRAFDDEVLLRDAMDRLPPPMPALLRLRFEQGLTQTEAGERLGLTQVQASRVERRAKTLLRALLAE